MTVFFFVFAFVVAGIPPMQAAVAKSAPLSNLEKQIAQEQARARSRRDSISRLTLEERNANKELAASEDAILQLERALEKENGKLEKLAVSDTELEAKGRVLRGSQKKIEEAMLQTLRLLWELHARRVGVKGRDLPDWPITDREHTWSAELFSSLDAQRNVLDAQQKELENIQNRRVALHDETRKRIVALNGQKEKLLQNRLQFQARLAELRNEKNDIEKELSSIVDLVRNLNLQFQEAAEDQDIAKSKGKLPWPVAGAITKRFTLSANPPVRGLTFTVDSGASVHAVFRGKVVHNDVLRGIGRVVILMHGDDYYSLYASLSESDVHVGQEVARGQIVGTAGFVTSINGPGLYFELRFHQKAINPEQWLRKS